RARARILRPCSPRDPDCALAARSDERGGRPAARESLALRFCQPAAVHDRDARDRAPAHRARGMDRSGIDERCVGAGHCRRRAVRRRCGRRTASGSARGRDVVGCAARGHPARQPRSRCEGGRAIRQWPGRSPRRNHHRSSDGHVVITGVPQTLQPLLADLVLCAGILALVVCAQVVSLRARSADVALLVFAATAVASVASMDAQPGWAVPRMLVVDPFGSFFQFTLSMMAMAEVWLAARSRAEPAGTSRWSATALAASLLGMFTMVSAANVVTAWLGFEMVSMAWALWIGTQRGAALAEAAAALLQAVAASATALLGFALLYGLTGTLEYAGLGSRLPLALAMPGGRAVLYTGLVLVLAGFASRIAVVAWQPWRADLTENAPLAVSAWLETAGTIAVLAMIARFLRATLVASFASGYWIALPGIRWPHVISVAAMVTMTMGNLAAVRADNLRRMIAWLSVAQSGYLMMGLAAASDRGLEAMLTHGV